MTEAICSSVILLPFTSPPIVCQRERSFAYREQSRSICDDGTTTPVTQLTLFGALGGAGLERTDAMAKGFILGVIVAVAIGIAGGFIFVKLGALPAGQDSKPGMLERWAAKTSLAATMARETRGLSNPLQPTEANLTAGEALYIGHCQVCHGGADAKTSSIAKGLTPNPPQLAKDGVEDDPEAATYWKIAHGIRFTGMPGFRQTLSEPQMWQIALFVKHMDSLPPGTRAAWAAGKPTS
jgi:thiosulfate dehydrogenase